MNNKKFVETNLEIDLHNLTVPEGKRTLERFVMAAPSTVREITVIHGFHRGTQMCEMVRKRFKCHKVARTLLTLNPGITILVLK